MLEDRSYMRSSEFRSGKPAWMILIIVNVVCFALQMINAVYFKFRVEDYLMLSPKGLSHGYVWQLLTFQFLHADFFHLLSNMFFGVWMFGRYIEDRLGKINFLKLYFLSGIAGGLLQAILGLAFPNVYGGATLGASAGAF